MMHFMRAFKIAIALCLFASATPALAAEDYPSPPKTQWWDQRSTPDVRYGVWLPCRAEWGINNDCVDGVKIYQKNGTLAGELIYVPLANFDPKTAIQKWSVVTTPTGEKYENSAYFQDIMGSVSWWQLPDGIKNSDGTSKINASVHMMNGGLQANLTSENAIEGSLPQDYYFETIIRSKNFGKQIKWIFSNVKDPVIKLEGDLIYVKGLPDRSPSAKFGDQICEPNELKAFTSQLNMAVNMNSRDAGRQTDVTNPGDVILGTNGWYCLQDFRFDQNLKQIVVKIGNVHYDEFGKVIEGWMELKIKGERAQKWWGMNPEIAAGFAKVEITYQDGTTRTATVTSTYDKKNDWINLRAYGFTYSQPQLAISFKKPESKVVPPVKKSITCIKGNQTRKITDINPKCPKGFKLK